MLVVLVVCHVVLISPVSGIWILTTIVLSILSSIVSGATGSRRATRCCWGSTRCRGLSTAVATVAAAIALLSVVSSLLVAIAALLGWLLFEAGVLLADVVKEGFAEFFRFLNHGGIRATIGC